MDQDDLSQISDDPSSHSNDENKIDASTGKSDTRDKEIAQELSRSDEKRIDDHLETLKSLYGLLTTVLPEIAQGLKDVRTGDTYNFTNSNISQAAIGPRASQVNQEGIDKKEAKKIGDNVEKSVNWLEWFKDKRVYDQAFIISLLFFPGNSPGFIIAVADELVRLLGVQEEPVNGSSSIFDKGISIGQYLRERLVKLHQESINTEAGKLSFESLGFDDSDTAFQIQRIVLTDYDLIRFRSLIRKWLVTISKYDHSKLQRMGSLTPDLPKAQAGLGLGMLARTELDALPLLIRPWASSENPNDRLMVGWILLGFFDENSQGTYWSNVSALLKHWSTVDNYYLRWTSVASTTRLGLIVSLEDDTSLVLSMSIIKQICKSGQFSLFRGVLIKSLRFLFSLSPFHARTICIELASWLKEDDEDFSARDVGAELFVELVDVPIFTSDDSYAAESISVWKLCEAESYILSDAVSDLIHQVLMHRRGTFVDYGIEQLSSSLKKSFEREVTPRKIIKDIFSQLNDDMQTARYLPLILGGYQTSI